ncbi:metallophosphoesterase [Halorussus sp. MSC15.2]|uniref:metallophosphoesterase n=1 Tax=Halorussus sp. MSC15.2 TaxID=2283638 RepID=UPI0013D75777|nr:metallophosphoesterase [Halorussus sp. MSC15.2]NEU55280.1 metallophosphoesterase [Halorussus sp. MSC15.2]
MITVVSDTHSRSGHELAGRTEEAVEEADVVVHAGDFLNGAALDAFEAVSDRLYGVYGNNATPDVRDRLPPERTFEVEGVRFVLTHGDDRGATGLSLLGRQQAADVVVFGHSHRHAVSEGEDVLLLNPGSHARPRGGVPTHAELRPTDGDAETDARLSGEIRHRDGSVVESFEIE